jgi:hypothetical protein
MNRSARTRSVWQKVAPEAFSLFDRSARWRTSIALNRLNGPVAGVLRQPLQATGFCNGSASRAARVADAWTWTAFLTKPFADDELVAAVEIGRKRWKI